MTAVSCGPVVVDALAGAFKRMHPDEDLSLLDDDAFEARLQAFYRRLAEETVAELRNPSNGGQTVAPATRIIQMPTREVVAGCVHTALKHLEDNPHLLAPPSADAQASPADVTAKEESVAEGDKGGQMSSTGLRTTAASGPAAESEASSVVANKDKDEAKTEAPQDEKAPEQRVNGSVRGAADAAGGPPAPPPSTHQAANGAHATSLSNGNRGPGSFYGPLRNGAANGDQTDQRKQDNKDGGHVVPLAVGFREREMSPCSSRSASRPRDDDRDRRSHGNRQRSRSPLRRDGRDERRGSDRGSSGRDRPRDHHQHGRSYYPDHGNSYDRRSNDYSPSRNYSHYSYDNRGRNTTTSTIAGTGHYSNYRRRQSHNDFYFYNNHHHHQRGRRNDSYDDYDDRRDSRWWERGANRWDNADPYHWETSYGYRGHGGGGGHQGGVFDQRRWEDRSIRR